MPDPSETLDRLARLELAPVVSQLRSLPPGGAQVLMIEAARVLDHLNVEQHLSRSGPVLSPQDFDIVSRGWNLLLSHLFAGWGEIDGFPLKASTPDTQATLLNWLHVCGRAATFAWAAEMLRHGIIEADVRGYEITLRLSARAALDHFHDQLDQTQYADATRATFYPTPQFTAEQAEELRRTMGNLTFPWPTSQGEMTGYAADPAVDACFLAITRPTVLQWREDAGLHPDARLPGCSGAALTAVVHALTAQRLKHTAFLDEAIKRRPEINRHMSLTLWTPQADLRRSLAAATGLDEEEVAGALDLLTVTAADSPHLAREPAPCFPLAVKLSEGYVLTPVSGIFRNPFRAINLLRSGTCRGYLDALRTPREGWMAEDLYALFEGPRFQCVAGQTRLSREGCHVTDIDAAIFDRAFGDLALFQLKWQDFSSGRVRSQRSRAANFTEQVAGWVQKTTAWIDAHGVDALCEALRLKVPQGGIRDVRFLALGRSNARFRSYGYELGDAALTLPWSQFVRLRLTMPPGEDVFTRLEHEVIREAVSIRREPLPYVLERHGYRITLADLWSALADDPAQPDRAQQ